MDNLWRTGLVSVAPCQLEYKYQNHPGLPWMVLIHGFGQNFHAFDAIYKKLEGRYSFLALHIFFHEESTLEGDRPLEMKIWADLIRELFSKLEIEKAHWIGYSMGAKFTLAAFQHFPQGFQAISLFAPDGLVMNPWYRFATQTFPGRLCMHTLLIYLPFLRYIVWILSKIGIIPKSLSRFIGSQLASSEQRRQVLDTWLLFRKIWPDPHIWHPLLAKQGIEMQVVLGKRDTVIPIKKFQSFKRKFQGIHWQEIKAGHSSLLDRWADQI